MSRSSTAPAARPLTTTRSARYSTNLPARWLLRRHGSHIVSQLATTHPTKQNFRKTTGLLAFAGRADLLLTPDPHAGHKPTRI